MISHLKIALVSFAIASFAATAHADVPQAEVQFVVWGADPQSVVNALGGEKLKVKTRDVYYVDTVNEDLFHRDLIIRARDSQNGVQTAVKRNFLLTDTGGIASVSGEGDVECEQDTYLTQAKVGCTLRTTQAQVGALSDEQRAYLSAGGATAAELASLQVFGPAGDEAWDFHVDGEKVGIDVVRLNGEILSLKLSTRVALAETANEQATWQSRLQSAGVPLCADQSGKTEDLLSRLIQRR